MPPDLSIIIPIYNRGDIIRYAFESIRRAGAELNVETIVVDDGSSSPIDEVLARLGFSATKLIRQENRGLLFARLTGLAAATGRHVLFLDSDDLVSPDKLTAQVSAMDREQADVSYTDSARVVLTGAYDDLQVIPNAPERATVDPAEFFIAIQPAPHSPVFRRDYLVPVVRDAFFPPSPHYNPVAEIWFYHNAAPRPGRVVYVPGPLAIIGQHADARLTNNWERLGVASLAVMEAFARTCPTDSATARRARRLIGEKAFNSWRRLPRGFSSDFTRRTLDLWRTLAAGERSPALGGGVFQTLAFFLGPVVAARLLRHIQTRPYDTCRTMTDDEFAQLLATIPTQ